MDGFDLSVGTPECPIKSIVFILGKNPTTRSIWLTLARRLGVDGIRIEKLKLDLKLNKINFNDLFATVIELWVRGQGSAATLSILFQALKETCDYGGVDVEELLRLEFQLPCRAALDNPSIKWTDLSPAYQNRVKDNLTRLSPALNLDKVLPTLHGSLLVNLMTTLENLHLFNKTIPDSLSYYVNRTIISRTKISGEIFQQNFPDLFLFSKMDRYTLMSLIGSRDVRLSNEQLDSITAKFIMLHTPNHYEKLCAMTSLPIHLLQYENKSFTWLRSRGQLDTIRSYISKSQQEHCQQDFLADLNPDSNLPVCFSDTPGMGKSILLEEIGRQLEKLYPHRIVIFLILPEFIRDVKQIHPASGLVQDVEQALLNTVCKNQLGKEVLKSKLMSHDVTLELLLDGFDEVNSLDINLAYSILRIIRTSHKSIRLWVTSRPHLLPKLEDNLATLGHNIKPFDHTDQLRFLVTFWSQEDKQVNKNGLEKFATECLENLRSSLNDQDVAGIPLQCLLIGELYVEEAIAFAKYNKSSPFVLINSITDLYKFIIARKIQKYLTVHMRKDFAGIYDLMEMHAKLSLELIFPERLQKHEHLFGTVDLEEIFKIGILAGSGTAPRFIHRTFAEYFVAWLVVDKLETNDLTQFIIEGVLSCEDYRPRIHLQPIDTFEFTHPVITYFLNVLINEAPNTPLDFLQDFFKSSTFKQTIQRIAHAATAANFEQIFKFFQQLHAFDKHGRDIFTETLLTSATGRANLSFFKLILTRFEKHHKFPSAIKSKVLRAAAWRGNFSLVEFLLNQKKLIGIVQELDDKTRFLLHDCVQDSDNPKEMEERIQIIRLLVGINRRPLEEKNLSGRTPLFIIGLPVQLVIELVNLGSSVLAAHDKNGGNILGYLGSFGKSVDNYHTLVTSISIDKIREMVQHKDESGDTPLIILLRSFDPTPETLDRLKQAEADFNFTNEEGDTVLGTAIKFGRVTKTIRKLVECGADLGWKGRKEATLLHLAGRFGNEAAVVYLVQEQEFEVNVTDKDGLSPLDYAIRSEWTNGRRFETSVALQKMGGIFQGIESSSLLHFTAEKDNYQSIQFLLHIDMEVNAFDEDGNTPLHKLMSYEGYSDETSFHTVQMLLDHGANPNLFNTHGETPFQIFLKMFHSAMETFRLLKCQTNMTPSLAIALLQYLIKKGNNLSDEEYNKLIKELEGHQVKFDYVDTNGNTLLHMAASSGHFRTIRLLIEKGASPTSRNLRQETPLHLGARLSQDQNNLIILEYLLEKGAEALAKDVDNKTFLHIYIDQCEFEHRPNITVVRFSALVDLLLLTGNIDMFNIPGGTLDATPLQEVVKSFEVSDKSLELLHANGINFNAVDKNGNYVLSYAIQGKRVSRFISDLINQFKADPRIVNGNGENIIHTAAVFGTPGVLRLLLQKGGGLDINMKNLDGETPLHFLVKVEDKAAFVIEKCQMLLKRGADVNRVNNEGSTPSIIALETYRRSRKLVYLFKLLTPAENASELYEDLTEEQKSGSESSEGVDFDEIFGDI